MATIGFSDGLQFDDNVTGALKGKVWFAQNHSVLSKDNSAHELPTLVTNRRALLLFVPVGQGALSSVKVYRSGQPSEEITLAQPNQLPASDQHLEDTRAPLQYSTRAWSATLPTTWMGPGVELNFKDNNGNVGVLSANKIDFEAPAELVLLNIRIGMLTEPTPYHWFEQEPAIAGLDYFQKIPVSKLTIAHYLPVHLKSVRMPNGKLYTTASEDEGGVYNGDMRENIGKALISVGINNANFGIVDSAGPSQAQPQHYRQVVVHTSIGKYKNGIHEHGLSGGNGMATLISTSGNEFSHELGHNHGLGHYPGGGEWSAQHSTSGWGYDDWRQRFIGNVAWEKPTGSIEIEGVVTQPFKGQYTFNKDPMGGGEPSGVITKLTLHTGYSSKRVQHAFSDTAVIDSSSSTGYLKWNATNKRMEVHNAGWRKPTHFGVPVVTLVGFFDPQGQYDAFLCPLYGNYGYVYTLPNPSPPEAKPYVEITSKAPVVKIALSDKRLEAGKMNKFHINMRLIDLPFSIKFVTAQGKEYKFTVETPAQAPQSHVVIGGPNWEANIVPYMPDFNRWRPIPKKVESFKALDIQLSNVYGPLHEWSSADRFNRRPGELYVYENPYNNKRQYFLLKKKDGYWYFPSNSQDNNDWRYLGDGDRFVNIKPNPIKARQHSSSANLHEAMRAYYQAQLYICPPGDASGGTVGSVWYRTSDKGYYWQRVANVTCSNLPTGTDNAQFYFLGFEADLQKIFFQKLPHSEFEKLALEWYGISRFCAWSERGSTTIGEIFHYDNPYKKTWDYFSLKAAGAGYFPTDHRSGGAWIYLGSNV